MPATLITPPAAEPVALADVKAELRLEIPDEDSLLARMVTAARLHVETVTRRVLVTQSWRIFLDVWPPLTRYAEPDVRVLRRPRRPAVAVELPIVPIRAVQAVTVYDAEGNASLVDPSQYVLDRVRVPALFLASAGLASRSIAPNGIEIDVLAGYGDPPDVPAPIREAIIRLAALWFEHRLDDSLAGLAPMPPVVQALIEPYRVLT